MGTPRALGSIHFGGRVYARKRARLRLLSPGVAFVMSAAQEVHVMQQTAKERAAIIARNMKEDAALKKQPGISRQADILEVFGEATRPLFETPNGKKTGNLIDYGAPSRVGRGNGAKKKQPLVERFFGSLKRSDDPDTCWTWLLAPRFVMGTNGPSKRKGGKEIAIAPRAFAWESKPPPRLYPQCRNGRCVRPEHMGPKQPPRIGNTRFMVENPFEVRKRLVDKTPEPTLNDLRAKAATAQARADLAAMRGKGPVKVPSAAIAPMAPPGKAPSPVQPPLAPLVSTSASTALTDVVRILDALDAAGRMRVLAAVHAFYPAA